MIDRWTLIQGFGILAGLALRLRQYAFNRSLWTDEGMIGLNILHRNYIGLTRTLDRLQAAPIGWLWLEKTFALVFGSSELSLRLPELLAGCLAVFGFALLARRLMSDLAATVCVLLFSISPALIFYSSDMKPYGVDAAVTIGLLLVGTRRAEPSLRNDLELGAAASAAVLVSYASVLLVAAMFAVRLMTEARRRNLKAVTILSAIGLIPAVLFLIEYLRSVRPTADAPAMRHFWASGYAPKPLRLGTTLRWGWHAADHVARYPLEATLPLLLLVVILVGVVSGIRRWGRHGVVVGAVPVLMAIAAVAGKYPFRDRMTVFAMPIAFLLAGWFIDATSQFWAKAALAAMVVVTFAGTISSAFNLIAHPYVVTEYREALTYAKVHAQPGDVILVNYQADVLEIYYRARMNFRTYESFALSRAGCDSPASSTSSIAAHERVWLLFGNFNDIPPVVGDYLTAFGTVGTEQLWRPTSSGAGVALFTLQQPLPAQIRTSVGCVTFGPIPSS